MPTCGVLVAISLALTLLILVPFSNLSRLWIHPAHALSDFNFDAVGDWGCNSNTQSTVKNIKGKNPERIFALGDYSYQPTATCWLNAINSIKSVTRINIGNHENDASEGNSQYMKAFGLSKQYYSFNYQNVHVLTMATELSYSKGSSQYNFVVDDLQKASIDPNIKWVIVNYHRVMYTSPNGCSASSCKGSSSLRDTYHPLFDKYGVDLVFQGHVHNYQRTFPLKYNPNSHSNPTKTSTSTSSYTDPQGEIFATVGTGGINFHGLSGKSSFVVYQQAQKFGILDITISNDGNKLQGKYYTNDGSLKDQFSISKSSISNYHYDPSLSLSGSNFYDVNSTSTLQLSKFSVATWFKTSSDFNTDSFIVNKGGFGFEDAGLNMNYGLYITMDEQVRGGFETSAGTNYFVSSVNKYNDGQWHYALVTNDGSFVRLYVDGSQIGSRSTPGALPDNSGIQPVRIGANSQAANSFFVGNADEIRIWNRALSSEEVANAYDGNINTSGQLLFIPSSSSITSLKTTAETILNVTNQTQASQNVTAQTTSSENANNTMTTETTGVMEGNSQDEDKLPSSLTPIINNTQTTEKKVPKASNNNVTVDNSNQNAESKPVIPKTTDEDVVTGLKNILPEANAKKNLLAVGGSQVLLDGSDSIDRDGKIDLYQWQQIKGPKVVLEDANNIKASFISPQVNHDTILVFKLTIVDDNGGSNSAITTVRVIDNQESPGIPPKIRDPSISNPGDKSVKTGDVTNATGG